MRSHTSAHFSNRSLLMAMSLLVGGLATRDAPAQPNERYPGVPPEPARAAPRDSSPEQTTPDRSSEEQASPASTAASEGEQGDAVQVVVTGTRLHTDRQNVPADVQVVGRQRLARPGTKSATAALSSLSGVKLSPRQENATFSDIEVRGLAGNSTSGGNVLVLLDGIPQRRLSFGGPYLGALPYEAVSRMELSKGPTSSLYGRYALAGALQLFTDPGQSEPHFDVSTSYEYPTNDLRLSARGSGPLGIDPPRGADVSTYSLTGGVGYAGGWQPRNEALRADLYLHVVLPLSAQDRITLLAGTFAAGEEYVAPVLVDAKGQRIAGISRDDNLAVPGQNRLDLRELRAAVRYTRDWTPELEGNVTVSIWHGDTMWKVGRPDDQPTSGRLLARSASDRRFVENALFSEVEVKAKYDAGQGLAGALSAGASYELLTYAMTVSEITTQEAFASSGGFRQGIPLDLDTRFEPGRSQWIYGDETERDTTEHDVGVFVRKQMTLFERLFINGGARLDTFSRRQLAPATQERARRSDWAVSPSAGTSVALLDTPEHRLNLFAGWGRGFSPVFRAVNNTQFADVEPETSESFELGTKLAFWEHLLELGSTLYQLERRDIVAMSPTTRLQQNVGDWRIRGIETDVRVRPIEPLALYAAYAWRDPIITRFEADLDLVGHQVPAISKHALSVGAEGEAPFGLGVGSELRYVSTRFGNEQNSFELPAYALWDAWMYFRYESLFRVAVCVKNIVDVEYLSAVFSGVQNGSAFEGTPRSYGLSLTAHL